MQGSVRKKGSKWYYSFEVAPKDGKRRRIERSGGNTKKEALTALRKSILEFENCGTVFSQSEMSVSDYFDYWMKEYVELNCKINTVRAYTTIIERHIQPMIGMYKMKNITPSNIQELINLKYRNGFSKSYLTNLYGILSKSFQMAVTPYQFIKSNPVKDTILPKFNIIKSSSDFKIISFEDYSKIIERFPFGANFHIPLQIAFNTGMRAAEVMGLTWDRINFESGYVIVDRILIYNGNREWVFGTPKTPSSNRQIKMGNVLIDLLKKHRIKQKENALKYGRHYNTSNFICTKENGDQLTTDSLKYLSRVVNYELMIPFNYHSLRHTHATMLLEAGANLKEIQTRLGHSRLATTMDTYSHVTKKMQENSTDLLDNLLKENLPT